MAERNVQESGRDGPPPEGPDGLGARIAAQRWVIAAATLLAAAGAFTPLGPGISLIAWAIVVAVALMTPLGQRAPVRRRGAGSAGAGGGVLQGATALAGQIPDPCLILWPDGRVMFQNTAARDIFGPIPQGRPVATSFRAPEFADALAQVRRSGEARRVTYFERVPIERRFEAFIAPLSADGDGGGRAGVAGLMIFLRDLTEQQRLDRMRADFVANASHELRTPLASLAGFIDTLQGAARDDKDARGKFLDIMRAQASRMSRLIDDLLSLSRIEQNAHIRPSGRVDLANTVAQVAEFLTPLAAGAGVEIKLQLPDEPVTVTGDRDELAQVFQNLIENAIKYGEDGKRVEIALSVAGSGPGRKVTVAVRDFGPGIPEEHIPRLTERFYRVDAASSREKGGTGLGLAIVKHILNRHRGQLQIASKAGEGATFSVVLPLADTGPDAATAATAASE